MRSISVTVAVFTLASLAEAGLRGGPIVERRRRLSSANDLPQHGLHRPGKQPKEIHDLIQASRARQLEQRRLPRSDGQQGFGDGKIVQYASTDGSVVEYAMAREDVMEPPQAISGRFMASRPKKPRRKPGKKNQQKGKDKKDKNKKDKKKGKKKPKRKPKIAAKKAKVSAAG